MLLLVDVGSAAVVDGDCVSDTVDVVDVILAVAEVDVLGMLTLALVVGTVVFRGALWVVVVVVVVVVVTTSHSATASSQQSLSSKKKGEIYGEKSLKYAFPRLISIL